MGREQEKHPSFEPHLHPCERTVDDDDESNENESNENESNENESNENESNENESNENESNENESSEEENPLPQWNIPNWRGNAAESIGTVCPCIKQVVEDGSIRGCAVCDDYWDMPSLVTESAQIECEGCYFLANGLGFAHHIEHTCHC
jgi:hypothetical protein